MGRRGPPPKPTALKVLEGNPGKQKLNLNEPQPPALIAVPKPPARLLKEAKAEWKKLAPALVGLGLLTEADVPAFTELCQNYGYYLVTDRKILDSGENGPIALQKTPSGYVQQHPLLSLRRQYYELWRKGLLDFGLTPASRARLTTDNDTAATGFGDPMEQILCKRW